MTGISLYCRGAEARAMVEGTLTAGAAGIPVEIRWDEQWEGLVKTLVCMGAGKRIPVVLAEHTAQVAPEALIGGMHLYLGMEGRSMDGTVVLPTVWADCGMVQPSAEGSHGSPTPGEMEQLLLIAAEAKAMAQSALSGGSGVGGAGADGVTFTPHVDGAGNLSWTNDGGLANPETVNIRGPQGVQGEIGPRGQKGDPGEDYILTAADKSEIAGMVTADVDTALLALLGDGDIA